VILQAPRQDAVDRLCLDFDRVREVDVEQESPQLGFDFRVDGDHLAHDHAVRPFLVELANAVPGVTVGVAIVVLVDDGERR
jgi:hypothetical protein